MADKGIDFVLSLNATKFQSALNTISSKTKAAGSAIDSYWKRSEVGAKRAGDAFVSMRTKILGAVTAIGGIYAVKTTFDSLTTAAMEADKASFNLGTSIQAANREFQVGSTESWRKNVAALSSELKIYTTQALEQAASKTVDMTKRLGLSEQQMVKVIRAAGNLGAGKFDLAESVERVTAALRGEAEASEALGLTLNENYVKAFYEASGATGKAWKDLTDLEKAQIRYNVLLQQSDPLLGKAAASANTYGGALQILIGNVDALKANLGQVVTENTFFINGIQKIGEFVKNLSVDVDANKTKWMEWAKQGALGALDFGVAGVRAASTLYSAFSGATGAVQELVSWYYKAKAEFLGGGVAAAKFKDALGITSGEAQRLGNEAAAAAAKANALTAAADRNFAAMGQGTPKLDAAAAALQEFRDKAAAIQATAVLPVEQTKSEATAVEQRIIKVGDTWKTVASEITREPVKPKIEIEWEAHLKSLQTLKAQMNFNRVMNEAETANEKASRSISGSWEAAASSFESVWERAIRSIAERLDSLQAKADRVASSSNGGGGGYASGGQVRGWSPNSRADNISAWLTAGEFVHPVARVKQYGLAFMESVRRGEFPVSLALAGISGRLSSLMASIPSGGRLASGGQAAAVGGYHSSITLFDPSSGQSASLYGAEPDVRLFDRAVRKYNRYRSNNR